MKQRTESNFLAYLAENEISIFTLDQAKKFWIRNSTTNKSISRLIEKKRIIRLERGIYLYVPETAGPNRTWTENSYFIASFLVQPSAIAYWSAMRVWNLTEQIPKTVFVQTTKRKRNSDVLSIPFQFITIIKNKFFGIISQEISGKKFSVTDKEKTIIDSFDRPDLCGGIFHIADGLKHNIDDIDWFKLSKYLERFGSDTVTKRLGYIVDSQDFNFSQKHVALKEWQKNLSKSLSILEPGKPKIGKISTRWCIRDNVFTY